jgi:hypothetical protein
MMADVACFCGCLYSFEGGAGACPRCGQVAAVTAGPASGSAGRGRQEQPAAAMNGAGPNGPAAGAGPEGADADPGPVGVAITPGGGPSRAPVLSRADR